MKFSRAGAICQCTFIIIYTCPQTLTFRLGCVPAHIWTHTYTQQTHLEFFHFNDWQSVIWGLAGGWVDDRQGVQSYMVSNKGSLNP